MWTHTAIKDGNWSDPTVWDAGTVPGHLARVQVGNFDVVYDVLSSALIKDLHVGGRGSIRWARSRTRLWVDSIMCHGYFEVGTWQYPIRDSGLAGVPQADIIFWASEAPGVTSRLGLMVMGGTRICGAPKVMRTSVSVTLPAAGSHNAAIPAGATSLVLAEDPAGWRIGDKILIAGTQNAGATSTDNTYQGPDEYYASTPSGFQMVGNAATHFWGLGFKVSQDETRIITAIEGRTIRWAETDPLEYDHNVYVEELPKDYPLGADEYPHIERSGRVVAVKPIVAMLTHSVRFRSARASDIYPNDYPTVALRGTPIGDLDDLQKRAHMMAMHTDDVQWRYAEGLDLARTDTNPTLSSDQVSDGTRNTLMTASPENGGVEVRDPNNVKGRYAWHHHGGGAYNSRKLGVFQGLTVHTSEGAPPIPGWAITQHNSRTAVEFCIGYNIRGAGLVSENGNEIGHWYANHMSHVRGDGFRPQWGLRAEFIENHNGHAGIAYENQARQILQIGNTCSSCHYGWFYMQQNTFAGGNPYKVLKRLVDEFSLRLRDPVVTSHDGNQLGSHTHYVGTYVAEQPQIPPFEDNIAWGCQTFSFFSHRQFTDRMDITPMIARRNVAINCPQMWTVDNYSNTYFFYDNLHIGGDEQADGEFTYNFGTIAFMFVVGNNKTVRSYRVFKDSGLYINFNGCFFDIETRDVRIMGQASTAHGFTSDPTTHPLYNAMGDWSNIGATSARVDDWTPFDSATAFPLDEVSVNRPRGTRGIEAMPAEMQTAYDAHIAAGGSRPFFWLDPTSDTHCSGANSIGLKGVIADSMGLRIWPSHQIFYAKGLNTPRDNYVRVSEHMDADRMARRNGCWNEAGTWKSRLWFMDANRATGEWFPFSIDVTLSGLSAEAKAKYDLGAPAPKPTVDSIRALEKLPDGAYAPDTSLPVINSPATIELSEGVKLVHRLFVNRIHGFWSFSGPDAAQVKLVIVDGSPQLHWENGTRVYEAPLDADGDNIYRVTVSFTDALGNIGSQELAISVTDVDETVSAFSDDFTGDGTLESREGWSTSGAYTNMFTSGGTLHTGAGTTGGHAMLPYQGRVSNLAYQAVYLSTKAPRVYLVNNSGALCCYFIDSNTFRIRILQQTLGGKNVEYKAPPMGTTIRVELYTDTLAVLYDGVLQSPKSGSATLEPFFNDGDASHSLFARQGASGGPALDDFWMGRI